MQRYRKQKYNFKNTYSGSRLSCAIISMVKSYVLVPRVTITNTELFCDSQECHYHHPIKNYVIKTLYYAQ